MEVKFISQLQIMLAVCIIQSLVLTVYVTPTLTSINPVSAFPGQIITLSSGSYSYLGGGFGTDQGSVDIGGQNAQIKTWGSSSILAYVPNISPGSYNVTVKNPGGGVSQPQPITIANAPAVQSLSASQVVPGVTNLCIIGSNFGTADQSWSGTGANSQILMGSIKITLASWTDKRICFDVPSTVTQSGSVNVTMQGFPVPYSEPYTISNGSNTSTNNGNGNSGQNVGKQYYLNQINATTGWLLQKDSPNVIVAVIDDGIYLNHPDIAPNTWINSGETVGNKKDDDKNGYVDDIYGWDFISNTGELTARGSHGTHVAGIIGAISNPTDGISGITQKVKLMSLIACDPRIGCPTDAVVKAIRYAADNGANVINLSLGSLGVTTFTNAYDDAISYAYNKGVVVVAAGGNGDVEGGIGQDTGFIPVSPVCNKSDQGMILGVGAVDDQGARMYWSNYGKCVQVYAPGKAIYSTSDPVYDNQQFFSSEDGTSFSTPMVSGLAALLKGKYPTMPNSEIISRIIRDTNKGVIDIYKTLSDPYSPTAVQVQPNPIQSGTPDTGSHQIGINVKSPDGTISMIAPDGTRRPYTSAGAFLSYGFNSFSNVVDASSADLALPAGSFIPPRDGKIICSDRSPDKGTCYLITNGQKSGFTSAKIFTGLGFNFGKTSKGDVSWMSDAGSIGDAQSAHRSGVLINNQGTYYLISDSGLLGIPDANTLQSWGYAFSDAVSANDSDKSLTQVSVIQVRQPGQLSPQ